MQTPTPLPHDGKLARLARERYVGELGNAFRTMADEVLLALSAPPKPGAGAAVQERQTAMYEFQGAKAQWVAGATRAIQKHLKPLEITDSGSVALARPTAMGALAFTLMDESEIENKILASRLAIGMTDEANRELNDLRLRIQQLENSRELSSQDVLKPDTVATVMVDQWIACGLSRERWSLVSAEFRKPLAQSLLEAYHHANEFLVGQGVMPEIDLRAVVRRSANTSGAASGSGTTVTGALAPHPGGGAGGGGGASAGIGGGSGSAAPGNGPSQAPGPEGAATKLAQETRLMTQVGAMTPMRERAQGVLGQLRQFLTEQVAGFQSQGTAPPSPALAQALRQPMPAFAATQAVGFTSRSVDVGVVSRELERQTTELKSKAGTASEKAIIEIVALMFQSILAEERIPAGVRVWFARLQMPVLREAVAEPEFFGSLNHPARLLIDQMGSVALGFEAQAVDGKALEAEIRRVVETIEQYPETGKRVFELMGEEFQQFLSRFLTEKGPTQRVMSVARQVEEKETLAIKYTIEFRDLLKANPAPHEIREFLFKVWAEVMAMASMRFGALEPRTLALKRTANDLLEAASAKPNTEARAKAIAGLAQLQKQLREGMELLSLPAGVQQIHVKILSDTLNAAFKSKTQVMSPAQIEEMGEQLAELESLSGPGGREVQLDPVDVKMLLGTQADAVVVSDGGSHPNPAMLAWAIELEMGNWFTLDHKSQLIKTQYVWRSERKQLHLFAALDGKVYLMQTRRLAAYLQAGLLVPTEDETLTVRATRQALAKLGTDPHRLLH